jgi:hypothetical protein
MLFLFLNLSPLYIYHLNNLFIIKDSIFVQIYMLSLPNNLKYLKQTSSIFLKNAKNSMNIMKYTCELNEYFLFIFMLCYVNFIIN